MDQLSLYFSKSLKYIFYWRLYCKTLNLFQDKLSELKRQLAQLNEGSHPDWTKKLRRLETSYRERQRINTVIRDLV